MAGRRGYRVHGSLGVYRARPSSASKGVAPVLAGPLLALANASRMVVGIVGPDRGTRAQVR